MLELLTRTTPVEDIPDPLPLLDPADPLLWWRDGEGMLGLGRAVTLTFSGPERFTQARRVWAALLGAAERHGATPAVGGGLAALGTFAFDDAMSRPSVLIVPSLLITRRGGRTWATRIVDRARVTPPDDPGLTGRIPLPDPDQPRAELDRLEADRIRADVARLVAEAAPLPDQPGVPLVADDGARHAAAVTRALERIDAGTARKIVLARPAHATLPAGHDLRVTLARLAAAYPDCWTFAVDGFIGASPETLVAVRGGHVRARVLAGTRPVGATDDPGRPDLLDDPKERAEHDLAARSVIDALAPHVRDLRADGPHVITLPNVRHLATDVTAELAERLDSLGLAAALHPTAAVAGVPREAALIAIHELEPEDRGRYAGPVGWIDALGDGEWAIGLRSAQRIGDTLTAWAGGGIVAGSDPAREVAETDAKLRPVRDALAD